MFYFSRATAFLKATEMVALCADIVYKDSGMNV